MRTIRQPRASTERDITNAEALMIALLAIAVFALGWLWLGGDVIRCALGCVAGAR